MHPEDIKASLAKAGKPCIRIAEELRISRAAVSATVRGETSRRIADRIAATIGKSLSEIWPGKYDKPARRTPRQARTSAARKVTS